ncbi:MAG: hypothetical protein Q9162_004019 [Coniocarpon cinnabarinum]
MNLDPATAIEAEDEAIMRQKIINEEYKIWKKHAPFLYDVMMSRALDWPTLTTQWFPDVQRPPGESRDVHRLLLGTHTDEETNAMNYLQIAHISIPKLTAKREDYDEERGEFGGFGGGGGKPAPEMKFTIAQKIDHPGEINKARYMPQNPDMIATMAPAGRCLIFDRTKHSSQPTGTVSPDMELEGHTEEGFGLHWNPNVEGQVATGSNDNTVKVWNIKDYQKSSKKIKPQRTFTHHSATVNGVEFHHKFPWMLATVSDDHTLQVLDLRESSNTKAARIVEDAHTDDVNCVAFNLGTDVILATGSADKSIGIWDLRNLEVKLHACEGHKDVVTGIEWHPRQKAVFGSASLDRRIHFWDLNRCGEEQTPEDEEDGPPELLFMHGGHTDRIADFTFNKNDPWLMCSAAEDNLLQIWKTSKSIIGRDMANVPIEELEK